MGNHREILYLSALLHDIGKFYQRADTGSVATSQYLSGMCKAENVFLPFRNGYYSHNHCLWTAQFINDHQSVFKNLVGVDFLDVTGKNNLYSLAACHHLKKSQLSELGRIVKEADCLSSGMDRETDMAFKDDQDENNWEAYKKKRMISILETVHFGQSVVKYRIPAVSVSLSKDYFPKKQFEEAPDYERLWNDFLSDFKCIQANDTHAFSESLLNLLHKYTSCIPASTVNFPDVSLYDHLKTTAAMAVCLYDYNKSKTDDADSNSGSDSNSGKKSPPFLLIGGDLCGIQTYLYQLTSKYAGKNLKGRSFFLRIVTDAVVRYLLRALHLFQANVIYNSGGSFYLIAPHTEFVKGKLKEAIQTIEERFFTSFGTSLSVAIESVPLSKDDLMRKDKTRNFGTVWHDLFEKKDKKKVCKFAGLIEKKYDNFFEPLMQGGNALRDEITGEEFLEHERSDNNELVINKDTHNQIELGEKLCDTDVLIISGTALSNIPDVFHVQPANLGYYYYFLHEQRDAKLLKSVDNCTIVRFNNENFSQPVKGVNNTYELQFYGGNEWNGRSFEEMVNAETSGYAPPANTRVHLFDKKVKVPVGKPDFKRLGILRMDVDNLGAIFQSGILPERATLSRFAALSRSFDYFFSGYLNTIWNETDPSRTFIIYSGGDDLFVVGQWDAVIRMAKKIHYDFREFTCNNPAFGISGGIAIVPEKYPIMKGADECAGEERTAKNHTVTDKSNDNTSSDNSQHNVPFHFTATGKSKNSISFMGFPMNWDTEFPMVEYLKDELVRLIEKEKEAKSLLTQIMAHAANAGIKMHEITNMKTYWMLVYDLSRMKDRTKNEKSKMLIDNCITEVYGNKPFLNGIFIETRYHALELWAFAARWAELEIR